MKEEKTLESKSNARLTVGKSAIALQEKASKETGASSSHSVIDQTQEQLSEYLDNLKQCVYDHKNKIMDDFYVVVITKKERLLENVLRNYFLARQSCPTPDYDQAVYFYDYKKEDLSFIWVIPDKETCMMLIKNMSRVAPEEQQLLQYAIDFASGKLFWLAKQRNGERQDSVILEN